MTLQEIQTRFYSQICQIPELLQIAIAAVATVEASIELLEARKKLSIAVPDLGEGFNSPESIDRRIEKERERLPFAQSEIDHGFPLLHSQAVVLLWAALEVLVEDSTAWWLLESPHLLNRPQFGSAKVDLVSLMQLSDFDRMRFIVSTVASRAPVSDSFSQLERQAGVIGIDPFHDGPDRRNLVEFGHVRNLILHRGSIADLRFQRTCPWLGVTAGEAVAINGEGFDRYYVSTCEFALHLSRSGKRIARDNGLAEYPQSDGEESGESETA